MKTETQIAEENLNHAQMDGFVRRMCEDHKASCQRFLEFLKEEMEKWKAVEIINPNIYISTGELEEKITDLKQAIKLYDDNGI